MKFRIATWAAVGALVVVFWSVYIWATPPAALSLVWPLVYLTCPVALARQYSMGFYFVLLVNSATYMWAGLIVETIQRRAKASRV